MSFPSTKIPLTPEIPLACTRSQSRSMLEVTFDRTAPVVAENSLCSPTAVLEDDYNIPIQDSYEKGSPIRPSLDESYDETFNCENNECVAKKKLIFDGIESFDKLDLIEFAADLNEKMQTLEDQNQSLKQRLEEVESENRHLRETFELSLAEPVAYNEETEIKTMIDRLVQSEKIATEALDSAKSRIQELEDDHERMYVEITKLEHQLSDTQTSAAKDKKRYKTQYEDTKAEYEEVSATLRAREADLISVRLSLKKSAENYASDQAQNTFNMTQVGKLEKRQDELERMLNHANKIIDEQESILTQLGVSMSDKINPLEAVAQNLQIENDTEVTILSSKLESMTLAASEFQLQLQNVQADYTAIQAYNSKLEAMLEELSNSLENAQVKAKAVEDINAVKVKHAQDLAKLQILITMERADVQWKIEKDRLQQREANRKILKNVQKNWIAPVVLRKTLGKVKSMLTID